MCCANFRNTNILFSFCYERACQKKSWELHNHPSLLYFFRNFLSPEQTPWSSATSTTMPWQRWRAAIQELLSRVAVRCPESWAVNLCWVKIWWSVGQITRRETRKNSFESLFPASSTRGIFKSVRTGNCLWRHTCNMVGILRRPLAGDDFTNILREAFLCLHFRFELFLVQE
jgi:hypothetical protein